MSNVKVRRFPWVMLGVSAMLGLSSCGGGGSSGGDAAVDGAPIPSPSTSVCNLSTTEQSSTGSDPLASAQWHLSTASLSAEGLSVDSVWNAGLKGENVLVGVVDSVIQISHPDLIANTGGVRSINYRDSSSNPGPEALTSSDDCSDYHGTAVAGIIGARDLNGIGVKGVAPRVRLAGLNALAVSDSSAVARAMTDLANDGMAISANSWGQPDGYDGRSTSFQDSLSSWKSAVASGTDLQRTGSGQGRGIIYLYSAGNGGASGDNANQDGYANSRHVIAVAAVDSTGRPADYSEPGSNILIAGYAGNTSLKGLSTLDLTGSSGAGVTNYYNGFSGTSAATPTVAGVAALMLQSRPDLSWRDVRWLLAKSARAANLNSNDGANASGATSLNTHGVYSHLAGFGIVNADRAVTAAKAHSRFGDEITCSATLSSPNLAIPDNKTNGVSDAITLSGCAMTAIEHVEVVVATNHTYVGDLQIDLTSPSGTLSRLATPHVCETPKEPCPFPTGQWTFGSVRHMGETGINGLWTLKVSDLSIQDTGTLGSWRITLRGH